MEEQVFAHGSAPAPIEDNLMKSSCGKMVLGRCGCSVVIVFHARRTNFPEYTGLASSTISTAGEIYVLPRLTLHENPTGNLIPGYLLMTGH